MIETLDKNNQEYLRPDKQNEKRDYVYIDDDVKNGIVDEKKGVCPKGTQFNRCIVHCAVCCVQGSMCILQCELCSV